MLTCFHPSCSKLVCIARNVLGTLQKCVKRIAPFNICYVYMLHPWCVLMFCLLCSWLCSCPHSYRTNVQVGCQWATPGAVTDSWGRWVFSQTQGFAETWYSQSLLHHCCSVNELTHFANCTLSDIQLLFFGALVRADHFYPHRTRGVLYMEC